MMKTVAVIYARVSSIGDRQSTDRQVKDLMDYALYKEYEVLGVYTEHISGAKKNGERQFSVKLLNDARWNHRTAYQIPVRSLVLSSLSVNYQD